MRWNVYDEEWVPLWEAEVEFKFTPQQPSDMAKKGKVRKLLSQTLTTKEILLPTTGQIWCSRSQQKR